MFFRPIDFARKIVFPNEMFVFSFWKELVSGAGSFFSGNVGSLIGTGVSLLASKSASKGADKSANAQARAIDQQNKLAQDQWDRYKNVYAPLEEQVVNEARVGITPDINGVTGRASADVTQNYDTTRESTNRTLGRYGINPNSGRFESSNRALDIAEAGDRAGSVNRARTAEIERADNKGYARKQNAVALGKGIPSSVQSNLASVSNSYGNQAATYGRAASSTGQFVSGLPWNDLFSSSKKTPAPTTSGYITPAIPSGSFGSL